MKIRLEENIIELEVLSTFSMSDFNYMEEVIYNETQQEFVLKGDIGIKFSNEVIQLYYKKRKIKTKKDKGKGKGIFN